MTKQARNPNADSLCLPIRFGADAFAASVPESNNFMALRFDIPLSFVIRFVWPESGATGQ
jgi:hypothetical protein